MNSQDIFDKLNEKGTDYEQYLSRLNEIILNDKIDGSNYNNIGFIYHNLKRYHEAEIFYKLAIDKGSIESINNLAFMYDELKRYEEAEVYYKMAIEKEDIDAIYNLASMYEDLERYEEAEIYFKMAIENGILQANENIKILPKKLVKIYTNIHEDNCVICLEHLVNNYKNLIILTCGHSYHFECYNKVNKCSMCNI